MPPNEWPAVLNRKQFEQACKALLEEREQQAHEDDALRLTDIWSGWEWKEHSRFLGFGYLNRTVALTGRLNSPASNAEAAAALDHEIPDMPEIPDDPAMFSDPQLSGTRITVEEHIVYSPTFQVPAFYFTASDSSGAPLPLPQVIRSTLFHLPLPLSTLSIHQHTVDLPGTSSDLPDPDPDPAPLPLLTQGEHPTTGRACWYIHPCETSAAVKELLDHRAAPIIEGWEVEWLRVWFVILGRVIYLRSS